MRVSGASAESDPVRGCATRAAWQPASSSSGATPGSAHALKGVRDRRIKELPRVPVGDGLAGKEDAVPDAQDDVLDDEPVDKQIRLDAEKDVFARRLVD